MESAQGTIIRLTKLSDSSLIVHWFTLEHGLIKTVARGGRQAKGAFLGKLDLFVQAELEWRRSRRGELHQLQELTVSDHRFALRKSYRDTLVAGYFSQLLEGVLELEHEDVELYGLLQRALGWLVEKDADRKGVLYFEKELSRLLGLGGGGGQALRELYGNLPKCRDHCLDLLK